MKQSLIDKTLSNAESFEGYRLWDCIHHPNTKHYPDGFENLMDFTYKTWPNSIAGEYCKKNNFNTSFNPELLNRIVSSRIESQDSIARICIHLRIGDVIKYKGREEQSKRYLDTDFYSKIISKISCHNNIPCFFVFGMHYNVGLSESIKYIKQIKGIFDNFGFKARYRTSTPDNDFLFLCQSKFLLSSKSNFFSTKKPLVRSCFKGLKIY